jgi:serine/threonine-protein kinase
MTDIGNVIEGRYEIVRLLGESALGTVFEVIERSSGDHVALKLLRRRCSFDAEVLVKYYEAHRAKAAFESANVCAPIALGATDEGRPYLVMPLLEGQSLAEVLQTRDVPLSFARAVDICCQILGALQSIHDSGVVHGNLKPSNVFLATAGDREVVKLLDVGLAEALLSAASDEQRESIWKLLLGAPEYLAPEQVNDDRIIDPRADLHAVGVLLYRFLTGAHPYRAALPQETIARIVGETPPRPTSVKLGVPGSVEQVILTAMSKDPEDRYSSARQLKHALINQARQSGRQLPSYLEHREFTGKLPVLDPTQIPSREPPENGTPENGTPESGTPRRREPSKRKSPERAPHRRSLTTALICAISAAVFIGLVLISKYC